VAWAADTTYYFVLKLSDRGDGTWDGASDLLEAWVNPTDVSSEAGMTASSLAYSSNDCYNGVGGDVLGMFYVQAANFTGNTVQFDEFRLGTDLGSVIPEPTALAALAFGAAVLLLGRRRSGAGA